ncbi:MAG: aspartate aminotransferase family protein [Dehalococcoidia bacterium]|nr:aspartate aminotransferase family protein [Dehalococcoidia bacterium]
MSRMEFPQQGLPGLKVLDEIKALKTGDSDWKNGRVFSLVFNAGDEIKQFAEQAFDIFLNENGLSPFAFPSLLKMENEVVAMMIDLLGGGEQAAGNVTTGGTESLMSIVKTARDYARDKKPHIKEPQLVMPLSAHPAFNKAAHFLGIKTVIVPTDTGSVVDLDAYRSAISENTIMLVGSAPSYPHGIIDPIEEIGRIALEKDIWFHVDACVGGMVLPFVRMAGYEVPPFDLSVPGVWSISADIHKYGYTPKGASIVLYRSSELRKYQIYVYADWPGGVYATSSVAGSHSGGGVASSWGIFRFLGREGYTRLAGLAMQAALELQKGVNGTPGLHVIGKPLSTVFAIGSDTLNVYALGEKMKARRWYIDSQQMPPSLHMTVMPEHVKIVGSFLADLREASAETEKLKPEDIGGEAALYGMIGSLPDRGAARDIAVQFLNDLYQLH